MSLDLAWDKLDESLATRLVDVLNKHLASVTRPSFIGPVEVTAIDFGTVCPDVQVIDMRDIYRDFLEDDEEEEEASGSSSDLLKTTRNQGRDGARDEEDDFEWVSRRASHRGMAQEAPAYHHLPPHLRYGRGPSSEFLPSLPGVYSSRDVWGGVGGGVMGMRMSLPNLAETHMRPGPAPLQAMAASMYAMHSPANPRTPSVDDVGYGMSLTSTPPAAQEEGSSSSLAPSGQELDPNSNPLPNLQLHLRILYHSDMRLSISTTLLINYPSPMFMSLPIKLSVTGFVFNGEVVVAYEGQRKRVHFCILDDLDPYGPAGSRSHRTSESDSSGTPPDDLDGGLPAPRGKPLPVGQRLLPSIFIESEIGQADKHVLKNVTRVERFIQDVIRKTVEDELVFPNFHTLLLGE